MFSVLNTFIATLILSALNSQKKCIMVPNSSSSFFFFFFFFCVFCVFFCVFFFFLKLTFFFLCFFLSFPGRLFRLLVKLGFVNERPEFKNNPKWSEHEDRYLVKLLRDFVFHTVNQDGSPNLDFAHVVTTLNKLDVASPEKALLMGRDEDSVLVASYADLRRCIEEAYLELKMTSQQNDPSQPSMSHVPHTNRFVNPYMAAMSVPPYPSIPEHSTRGYRS